MLGEYKVSRCTRNCHQLQRPLRDGEWYYSVVIESDEEYTRQDFSAECWQGPPEGAIGWWKNRMPTADEKKMVLAPPEVLIDLLRQMGNVPEKEKSRYLLALMMMRRRMLRPATNTDGQAADPNLLRFEVIADGSILEISACSISRSETESLKLELNELLYCEADNSADEPE